jgi:integrase
MGYSREKLKALTVSRLSKTPGLYSDGGGLYLRVTSPTACSWAFRYMIHRKAREMGLGKYPDVTLSEAREHAAEARRLKAQGLDPIDQRKAVRQSELADAAKALTFKNAAQSYIEGNRAGWRNAKHAAQWEATLATYAEPIMGGIALQDIDIRLVLKVLEPIWTTKPETASRLRGRIEAILDWAKARGYCAGENPARWRGHLDKVLPARAKVQRVKHHAALPFDELGMFMAALRLEQGVSARALEFAILTAARTGEVIGGKWSEFDLINKVWIVPGERMKAGREHRVPLSKRAMTILRDVKPDQITGEMFVFPGNKPGSPLSNMAFLMLLRRMKRDDLTVHGFRSTFRDWAAEHTNFPNEVAEMALAHTIGNKVEAAYRRGDMFEKRRALMNAWAKACAPNS